MELIDEIKKIVNRIEPNVKLIPNNENTFKHEKKV